MTLDEWLFSEAGVVQFIKRVKSPSGLGYTYEHIKSIEMVDETSRINLSRFLDEHEKMIFYKFSSFVLSDGKVMYEYILTDEENC